MLMLMLSLGGQRVDLRGATVCIVIGDHLVASRRVQGVDEISGLVVIHDCDPGDRARCRSCASEIVVGVGRGVAFGVCDGFEVVQEIVAVGGRRGRGAGSGDYYCPFGIGSGTL